MLNLRFDNALLYAHQLHRRQTRKLTTTPYFAHLMTVSALVIEHGGNEDQAIAALLHDAVEDQGGKPVLDEIRRRFGDAVATIVEDCTDAWVDPKPDWRPRKEAFIAAIPTKAITSQLVCLADKTHNAESILLDYSVIGDAIWERFSGGPDGTRWYYAALSGIFNKTLPGPLSGRLAKAVAGFSL